MDLLVVALACTSTSTTRWHAPQTHPTEAEPYPVDASEPEPLPAERRARPTLDEDDSGCRRPAFLKTMVLLLHDYSELAARRNQKNQRPTTVNPTEQLYMNPQSLTVITKCPADLVSFFSY